MAARYVLEIRDHDSHVFGNEVIGWKLDQEVANLDILRSAYRPESESLIPYASENFTYAMSP